MRKSILVILLTLLLITLAACGDQKDTNNNLDGLPTFEVEFEVPETLEVGDTLFLEAIVTYNDELVKDADEVVFEVWEKGKQDDSEHIDSDNNGDGTYTAEVIFDEDGIYEMYAHTTARGLHTMPKREVIVGEGGDYDDHGHDGFHTEGFDMHFMEPEDAAMDQDVDLITHIMIDEEAYENLDVRYEIWNNDMSENHDWVDAEENVSGEYLATHTFTEPGTYSIQVHVQDDEDLHEHATYEFEVKE